MQSGPVFKWQASWCDDFLFVKAYLQSAEPHSLTEAVATVEM